MKTINYDQSSSLPMSIAAEPEVLYLRNQKAQVFSINKFQDLNKKVLFSQIEWADILHISDRTLQRYIKEGKPFEGYMQSIYSN